MVEAKIDAINQKYKTSAYKLYKKEKDIGCRCLMSRFSKDECRDMENGNKGVFFLVVRQ